MSGKTKNANTQRSGRRRTKLLSCTLAALAASAMAFASVAVPVAFAQSVPVPVPPVPSLPGVTSPPTLPSLPSISPVPTIPTPQQLVTTVEGLPGEVLAYPGALNYTIHVVYQPPNGQAPTTTDYPATVGVPALISAGSIAPDLAVDMVIDPTSSHAALDVVKLPGAPAQLPVLIEAIFTLPSASGTAQRVVFGYNTLASTAPAQYQGTANLIQTQAGVLDTSLTFTDSQPGPSLVVVAGTGEQTASGLVNPETASLSYAPVPATASLTLTAGPQSAFELASNTPQSVADFAATFVSGPVTVDTTFQALPSQLTLTYIPGAGDFSYSASAPVKQITADDLNPNGVFGRATAAHLLLKDVPQKVDLTAVPSSTSGGTVTLDAHGQTIGLVQVDLTSGSSDATPAGNNGVLYEDLPAKYVVFARIYGLQKVSVTQTSSTVNATLDTTGGVPLLVDIQQQPSGGTMTFTDVTLDDLVPQVSFQFSQSSSGVTNINYTASAATTSLAVDTNAGGVEAKASMAGPLPASFAVCQSSNTNACVSNQQGGNGSFSISTSQPTTVNLTRGTVLVQNMVVHDLAVALQFSSTKGSLFFDTKGENLSGYATDANDPSGSGHFKVTLPTGFNATNRLITYQVNQACFFGSCYPYSVTVNRTGQITCPSGTQFLVYAGSVLGWLNITHGLSVYGLKLAPGIC